jgi:endo-1,4-beta-xylanase
MNQKLKNKRKHRLRTTLGIVGLILWISLGTFLYWYFTFKTPNLPTPPLKTLAASHGIDLGVHTSLDRLSDKPYTNIVTSQFSFITIDGEANWNSIHPSSTRYNYTKVDKLMEFAKANKMPVQIHHLIWGEQKFLPSWLLKGNYSPNQLLSIMHSYISNLIGHLKGQVVVWSVANEVFSRAQHDYGLSDWWADHTGGGTTYVNDAFIWAHQTDPNAKLILNDFNNETENSISNAEYNYIKTAKASGVPIDGIGMQMHIDASDPPTISDMVENIQRFNSIGVLTYITELDVNLNSVKGSDSYKNQLASKIYYDVVTACIQSKSCISIDEFGVTDKESLLKTISNTNSHTYLFTSRYVPSPSYYSFRQALLEP